MDLGALGARAEGVDPTIPTKVGRTLHFDGDYAAYYFSGNDDTPILEAQRNLERFVESKARVTGSSRITVHLTADWSDKGHRFKLATVKPYQGQRDSGRRPKNWAALRNYVERAFPSTRLWDDREADDGVAAASFMDGWDNTAILTRDKDFRMIPGIHVGWMHERIVHLPDGKAWEDSFQVLWDNDEYVWFGRQWFLLQLLQGDTADNIPGLPKVPLGKKGNQVACGPVTAEKWLALMGPTPWAVVLGYQAYYGEQWAEALAEQAALLWMRRTAAADDFLVAFHSLPEKESLILHDATRKILEERCA